MEGEGLATNGRVYHFAGPYGSGWLNGAGGLTAPCTAPGHWTNGRPARLAHPSWARYAPGHSRTLVAVEERRGRSQRDPVRLAHLHARALLDARARLGLCARHGRRDRRRAHRPRTGRRRRSRAAASSSAGSRCSSCRRARGRSTLRGARDRRRRSRRDAGLQRRARRGARGAAVRAHAPARGDTPRAARGTRRLSAARLRGAGAHDRDPGPRRARSRCGSSSRRARAARTCTSTAAAGRSARPTARTCCSWSSPQATGMTMVSVEYRLAPEHPFPAGARRLRGRCALARSRTTRAGSRSAASRRARTWPCSTLLRLRDRRVSRALRRCEPRLRRRTT